MGLMRVNVRIQWRLAMDAPGFSGVVGGRGSLAGMVLLARGRGLLPRLRNSSGTGFGETR